MNLFPSFYTQEITHPFFFRTGTFFWFEILLFSLILITVIYTIIAFAMKVRAITVTKPEDLPPGFIRVSNFFTWYYRARIPLLSGPDRAIHYCYTAALTLFSIVIAAFTAEKIIEHIPAVQFRMLQGVPYLAWSAVRNLAYVFLLIALLIDILKRSVLKISSLKTDNRIRFYFFIIFVFVFSGIFADGCRIVLNGSPDFEIFNFLAWPLTYPFSLIPAAALEWIHDILRFSEFGSLFLIVIGFSTDGFYQTLFPLLAITRTKRTVKGGGNYPLSRGTDYYFRNASAYGASHPSGLTPGERLSVSSCISCGNCQTNCPAWTSEQLLSPMLLINKIAASVKESIPFAEAGVSREELDACFGCAACMESCPVLIEHVPLITKMRAHYTERLGQPALNVHKKYRNLEYYGSSTGVYTEKRCEWLTRQDYVKTIDEQPECDYLLYVGCGWSDPSKHRDLLRFIDIISLSGAKISVLAEKESCCGDMALRTGNHLLFRRLAYKNLQMITKFRIKNILILCPHGFSAIDKEYRCFYNSLSDRQKKSLSCDYEVTLYTDFLSKMGREGKLRLNPLSMNVTIHDPCYPERRDRWYSASRELLANIDGIYLNEMRRNHEHSFCCGMSGAQGSGNYRFYGEASEYRAREAMSTGADTIVTSCHYCRDALSEALLSIDEEKTRVKSLIEIIHTSIFSKQQ